MTVLSPCLAPNGCSTEVSELNCKPHIKIIITKSKYEKILKKKMYISRLYL